MPAAIPVHSNDFRSINRRTPLSNMFVLMWNAVTCYRPWSFSMAAVQRLARSKSMPSFNTK
jgi:hypothetical protein